MTSDTLRARGHIWAFIGTGLGIAGFGMTGAEDLRTLGVLGIILGGVSILAAVRLWHRAEEKDETT